MAGDTDPTEETFQAWSTNIEYGREKLNDMMCGPDRFAGWTCDELADIAMAADNFSDVLELVTRRRRDREILASWLDPEDHDR